jgi:hypothetical protein
VELRDGLHDRRHDGVVPRPQVGVARTPDQALRITLGTVARSFASSGSDFVTGRAAWRELVGRAGETEGMGGQMLFLP